LRQVHFKRAPIAKPAAAVPGVEVVPTRGTQYLSYTEHTNGTMTKQHTKYQLTNGSMTSTYTPGRVNTATRCQHNAHQTTSPTSPK
jgi:hypothetical protein